MKAESLASIDSEVVSPRSRTLPGEIWLVSLAHFSNDFYNGFLAPLLPMLVVRLNISLALAGSLVSILALFNSLVQPFTGMLADRLHRNYFVVFASLLTGLFMSFIGIVNHYVTLALILALSGIGTSLFHPQGAALVGRLKTTRPGFAMSVFNMGGSFGFAIGPLVVVPLISRFGPGATVYTSLFAILVVFLTFPVLNRSPNHTLQRKPPIREALRGYWFIIALLFILVVMRATMAIAFQNFTPLFLTSRGNSLFLGASAVTIFQICGTVGILVGGFFSDRIKPATLLMISFLFVLPFSLVFVHLSSAWGLPFYGIAGFFLFSSTPVNILMGQRLLPKNASFVSGIMMGFAWGFGGLLATPIGALADWLGLYTTLVIISSLTIPGALVSFLCSGKIQHVISSGQSKGGK